jgi:hypothetical protein
MTGFCVRARRGSRWESVEIEEPSEEELEAFADGPPRPMARDRIVAPATWIRGNVRESRTDPPDTVESP